MDLEQRTFQFIKKNKLISPRGLVLIGVSGGADSMALLYVLSNLRHDLGVHIQAVHFNHRLRTQADSDEAFVGRWCKKLNVPLTVGRREGGKVSRLSEDDARQLRFDFFAKTARSLKAQSVALAHTRNDLAETVLMRLMRGTGLYGLRAILPRRSIEGIIFVRPLLELSRIDIEKYLKIKKVPFRTDATNHQLLYERNKVRHQLLPLMARKFNPRIINALSDLAATAGEDYEFLSAYAQKFYDKNVIVAKNKVKIDLTPIKRQHPAIVRLLLRQMVEVLTNDPASLSFEHIHALEGLVSQDGPGALDLPFSIKAVRDKKSLELFCLSAIPLI